MSGSNETLDDLLKFDAYDEATKETGSVEFDGQTVNAVMRLSYENSRKKKFELSMRNDSYRGMDMSEYLQVLRGIGFEIVLERPYIGLHGYEEVQYVLWNHGALVHTETYGDVVFRATMFFNLEMKDPALFKKLPVTGAPLEESSVFTGSIEVHEAALHYWDILSHSGILLENWKGTPWLFNLLNVGDLREDSSRMEKSLRDEIQRGIIEMLPLHVQFSIDGREN